MALINSNTTVHRFLKDFLYFLLLFFQFIQFFLYLRFFIYTKFHGLLEGFHLFLYIFLMISIMNKINRGQHWFIKGHILCWTTPLFHIYLRAMCVKISHFVSQCIRIFGNHCQIFSGALQFSFNLFQMIYCTVRKLL